MIPRLAWTPLFVARIQSALDGGIQKHEVQDTADPLRKVLVLELEDELPSKSWNPFQHLAHAYAKVNDCTLRATRKAQKGRRLELDIFIKRKAPKMMNDPFTMEQKKRPRVRRRPQQ